MSQRLDEGRFRRDVEASVAAAIHLRLNTDQERLTPQMRLVEDLGADSVALLELTLALEEFFDIDIPVEHAAEIRTVHDVVVFVEGVLAGRARGLEPRGF